MRKRFFAVLAVSFACAPASAAAAPTYSHPDGTGSACTQESPCSLPTAIDNAADEVVVLPGSYYVDQILLVDAPVDVHGPETGPRPVVTLAGIPSFSFFVIENDAAKLRNLTIRGASVGVIMQAGVADRLLVSGGNPCAVSSSSSVRITNSVCAGSPAISAGPGSYELVLRNVTAVGPDALAIDAIDGGSEGAIEVDATNVIASGIRNDVIAKGNVTVHFDHSNYDGVLAEAGATVTDAGSGTNQIAEPIFDPGSPGDFRQAPTSPTVDAGANDSANGPFDLDGDARTQGFGTDIGADEYNDVLPTALADSQSVAKGATATRINVRVNDTDPDGGPMMVTSATDAAHGAVVQSSARVTYEPDPRFCGRDTFAYTLNGGSSAVVSMRVRCPDTRAPNTGIARKPGRVTSRRLAGFAFVSTEAGSRFGCRVDDRRWRRCRATYQLTVGPGLHVIRVRATDRAGNTDRTPAVYGWRVLRPRG